MTSDEKFMKAALKEARKAYEIEECPIGCVIVKDDKIIARGHNLKLNKNNPLLHAETVAIAKASKKLGTWHLDGCRMYVTLEPCTMCSGAIIQSRIEKLFFGAYDPKGGAVVTCNDILNKKYGHNHTVEFEGGLLREECSQILKDFFKQLRDSKKN